MDCRIIIIKSIKNKQGFYCELIHLHFKETIMRILLFLLLFITTQYALSQDTLLLMNGKQFVGSAVDTSDIQIKFNINKTSNKIKLKKVYRDQVFSISYKDGMEKVFFYPDMFFVDDYTVANMRSVVIGKRDARNAFKTKWVIPVGFAACAASAFLMKSSFFVVLLPIAYTGIVQIPIVKIQKPSISSTAFIGNEFYVEGYNKSARAKRTKHALLSSISGVLAGVLLYELTK